MWKDSPAILADAIDEKSYGGAGFDEANSEIAADEAEPAGD